ncbi:hypothetical protein EV188_103175 [Actinomycetospora succinea]|uniref:Uncharacterized protein n=1 Tax=Actinomycetospora succinea TaxID=663603 RepID=A0A4R6VH91_9PSEU|nr:hypothetical protein [Actinomycetospora succinea]TDQ60676.1 hypothetical protein EV188_103175 [Actinomycetospora succinea]
MIGVEGRRHDEPEDAHRGWVAPTPADADEAAVDRAMADAERAVAEGGATDDQRARVARMGQARTHEERRAAFRGEG